MDINNIPIKQNANQVTDPNTQVSAEEFNALVDNAKESVTSMEVLAGKEEVKLSYGKGKGTRPELTFPNATEVGAGMMSPKQAARIADRAATDGMGYVVLDKDKTFAEQVTHENTIYEIRYDFDLGGQPKEIPAGCVLKFEGGSLKNGSINSNNTFIGASDDAYIFVDVNLYGLFLNDHVSVCWFGAKNSYYKDESGNNITLGRIDCLPAIAQAMESSFKKIYFPKGAWYVSDTITINKEVEFLLSGNSDSIPLNYKASSASFDLNEACVFTDKDISLVDTADSLDKVWRITISGGSFDVSLCENYSEEVIHLKSNCQLWGIDINTAVLAKLNRVNDGTGIYFDATVSTGYLSYIRTNCIVKYFGTGIKVKGTETQSPSWITDFVDRSEIASCRQSLYIEHCEEAFIEGHYQQIWLFEEEQNEVAAVYLKTKFATINCTVWDCHLHRDKDESIYSDKWTNRYAFELDTPSFIYYHNYNFVGNSKRYFAYGLVKDHTNIEDTFPKYQGFNRSQYTQGYSDTDNWFVKRPEFTATYESNCSISNFDDLFLPNSKATTLVGTSGIAEPYVNINIALNQTGICPLLMGIVMDINSAGTFTKAEFIRTKSNGETQHQEVDIVPIGVSHFRAIYFSKYEGNWSNITSMQIKLYGYTGTGDVSLLSVFGKVRGKQSSMLTIAGGEVVGDINLIEGAKLLLEGKNILEGEDNGEAYVQVEDKRILYLGDNLITNITGAGEGWTESNGIYTHTAGNTAPLEFDYPTQEGKAYVAILYTGTASFVQHDVNVSIGDGMLCDVYKGIKGPYYVGIISDGGKLKITPGTTYASTVHSIELREVVDKGAEAITIDYPADNVMSGEDAQLTSFWNVAIGPNKGTMGMMQNGSRNIAIGLNALQKTVSGERNVGIGTYALSEMKWGTRNIAIGADTIYKVEKPVDNVAIGMGACGKTNADPSAHRYEKNVAIGTHAMIGTALNYIDNTSLGYYSMAGSRDNATERLRNTSIGYESGYYSAEDNVSIGYRANRYNKGSKNIYIGSYSGGMGSPVNGGDQNIVIGYLAEIKNGSEPSFSNTIAIGSQIKATKSNQVVIGNKFQTELIVLGNKLLKFNEDGTVTWEDVQ
ncbi:MAG: hypothetical protein J6V52_02375 [Bacteroidaceae bacterium]|nr:hypothetical protein [Bacteroidaceae bacterium]